MYASPTFAMPALIQMDDCLVDAPTPVLIDPICVGSCHADILSASSKILHTESLPADLRSALRSIGFTHACLQKFEITFQSGESIFFPSSRTVPGHLVLEV